MFEYDDPPVEDWTSSELSTLLKSCTRQHLDSMCRIMKLSGCSRHRKGALIAKLVNEHREDMLQLLIDFETVMGVEVSPESVKSHWPKFIRWRDKRDFDQTCGIPKSYLHDGLGGCPLHHVPDKENRCCEKKSAVSKLKAAARAVMVTSTLHDFARKHTLNNEQLQQAMTAAGVPAKSRAAQLEEWQVAQQELNTWMTIHSSRDDVDMITMAYGWVIRKMEVMVMSWFHSSVDQQNTKAERWFSWENMKSYMRYARDKTLKGFFWILKHPKLFLVISQMLLLYKTNMCHNLSVELEMFKLVSPTEYAAHTADSARSFVKQAGQSIVTYFTNPSTLGIIFDGAFVVLGMLPYVGGTFTSIAPFLRMSFIKGVQAWITAMALKTGIGNLIKVFTGPCLQDIMVEDSALNATIGHDAMPDDTIQAEHSRFWSIVSMFQPQANTPAYTQSQDILRNAADTTVHITLREAAKRFSKPPAGVKGDPIKEKMFRKLRREWKAKHRAHT